jgi:hypothetical protein
MIKFSDIIKGVLNENYGFKDSSFDNEKIYIEVLTTYDSFALLKNPETNSLYITYYDDIDSDYHEAAYSYEMDVDDDGSRYSYREYSDDTELTNDGIALFTQHEIESNLFTDDLGVFIGSNPSTAVLLITKENKKEVFEEFIDLLKSYFDEPRKRKYRY